MPSQLASRPQAGVAGLLRVELRGRTAGRSRPRRRRAPRARPRSPGADGTARRPRVPRLHGIGVHEVEALVGDAGEQRATRPGRRRCSSPCAAGSRRAAPRRRRATPPALGRHAVLDAGLEQDLHADADAQHRAAAGQPVVDELRPPTARKPAMQAANAPTPGTTRPSAASAASESEVTVTSAPPLQRPLRRTAGCPSRSRGRRPAHRGTRTKAPTSHSVALGATAPPRPAGRARRRRAAPAPPP